MQQIRARDLEIYTHLRNGILLPIGFIKPVHSHGRANGLVHVNRPAGQSGQSHLGGRMGL
jgi:hypothetical protein